MPAERGMSIKEVVELLRNYDFAHQRRLSFEYIVFGGENDSPAHARAIVNLLKGLDCRINLIRFHQIPDVPLHGADENTMEPGQRVPAIGGRKSLRAREVARPRLIRRAVKGIAFSSHLEEDGIDAAPLQAVKLCRQHGTYLRGSLAYILAIDALYPCTTKLTLGVGGREASGTGEEDCRQKNDKEEKGLSFHVWKEIGKWGY